MFAAAPRAPGVEVPWSATRLGTRIVVVAARVQDGPVGPFHLMALLAPTRLGLRVGLTAVVAVVDTPAARVGVREHWGLPAQMGTLRWDEEPDRRRLIWRETQTSVVASALAHRRRGLASPMRLIQRRSDGPVLVSGSFRGRVRRSRVDVVAADGPFSVVDGSYGGIWLGGLEAVVGRARRPVALAFSQRAPHTAPEPALSGWPDVVDPARGALT